MKRFVGVFLILVAAFALPVFAEEHGGPKSAEKTMTGELVDMGCYLGHAAHGEKHISCASKCIANGMPMGLLTSNNQLYLITLNHDNADPYNSLKNMAGKNVTVTGEVATRNGIKAIDVTAAQLASK